MKVTKLHHGKSGNWFVGRDDKMASYPYGRKADIYKGNAYNTFSRQFLEWFFNDEKSQLGCLSSLVYNKVKHLKL